MAVHMQIASDSTMGAKTLAESPDMQKALYVQLFGYIFPGCLLFGLAGEVIVMLGYYYFRKALITTTAVELGKKQAEECMALESYNLNHYGDVITNMMLCCTVMVFTYRDVWLLCLATLFSMSLFFMWDHVRVICFTAKTVCSNCSLDTVVMYMMSLPCAVLASGLVFRAYGASHEGFLEEFRRQMKGEVLPNPDRHNIFIFCGGAFAMHVLVHCLVLYFLLGYEEEGDRLFQAEKPEEKGDYDKCAKKNAPDFFNTNPVHCLRSEYIFKHDAPCVPFQLGYEEHLMNDEKRRKAPAGGSLGV
jgi:hypothetical protein